MKRYAKPLIAAIIIGLSVFAFTSCNKDKEQTSAPVTNGENTDKNGNDKTDGASDDQNDENTEKNDGSENSGPDDGERESLTIQLGNDIGRNISKLSIRPDSESEWTEISIDGGIWKSGYMIPVKIEADSIPSSDEGWEIEVTFSDDSSTKIFENVPLDSENSIILTEEGALTAEI
ncbi:hypothetical protein NE664_08710 [Anaerotignum faecicola]|nr:hypothetical protein [Anaerotignum faecicola]